MTKRVSLLDRETLFNFFIEMVGIKMFRLRFYIVFETPIFNDK